MTNDQNPDNLAPLQPSLDTTAPAVPAGVFDDLFDHAAVFDVSASPVLIVHARQAYWVQGDTAEAIDPSTIRGRLTTEIPLVLHAPSLAKRLDLPVVRAADLLELYAFVRPASFVSPTYSGFAQALGLKAPQALTADQQKDTLQGVATFMRLAAQQLLAEAAATPDAQMIPAAWMMARAKWPWAAAVMTTLGERAAQFSGDAFRTMRVWDQIDPWEDEGTTPKAGTDPVMEDEARTQLDRLLTARAQAPQQSNTAERRTQQADYAAGTSAAFRPRDEEGQPNLVLAEAGTGVGKTLGYLAPATVWAAKNNAPVWISTYTRNLQRQIDQELDRMFEDRAQKSHHVVVRKGRENYLCLLNYQEAVLASGKNDRDTQGMVLMARWLHRTYAGDLEGGDLPGWLVELFGPRYTTDLSDHRGECLYTACAHYNKCFIEKNVRAAKNAKIVVANHALVMTQADGADESLLPTHYVFDEGHHLFDAADAAFAAAFTGMEGAELRRWLLGPEDKTKARGRGLAIRLEDILALSPELPEQLAEIEVKACALPGPGWYQRLAQSAPEGPGEYFLSFVGEQVYARNNRKVEAFSIECAPRPPVPGMIAAAKDLARALDDLVKPIRVMKKTLLALLEALEPGPEIPGLDALPDENTSAEPDPEVATNPDAFGQNNRQVSTQQRDYLGQDNRRRIDSLIRSIERRAEDTLMAWIAMLRDLEMDPPAAFVDYFRVERVDGRDRDLGYFRHFIDPTDPLIKTMSGHSHGILVTSATLTSGQAEKEDGPIVDPWGTAESRTGARHLAKPALRVKVSSPYDYGQNSQILIVGDVPKDRPQAVASAYKRLFLAANGGSVGLFTAVSRLVAVQRAIVEDVELAGLRLLAQHVDPIATGTLIDIFRDEVDSCLLGTDAVRDGVDVPGRSLRQIVFDRVPWPRPDIVHKARREAFGGREYDEMVVRLKLKQGFGRLIRRFDDRGVFVLLDGSMPSRLEDAFPAEAPIWRCGIDEAVDRVEGLVGIKP